MTSAIAAAGICKRFGSLSVLDRLDLAIDTGTCYGLIGANGAGKTSTLKILSGLAAADAGSVRVLGKDFERNGFELRSLVGVMPEGLALLEHLTGWEHLEFVARLHGLDSQTRRGRIEQLLAVMDLGAAATRLITAYSYGMRKKLAFAAAVIHGPRLVLLDEPLEGVDAVSRIVLQNLMRDLIERGTTIFLTSNSLELVERVCTHVGVLREGRIRRGGRLADLLNECPDDGRSTLEDILVAETPGLVKRFERLSWF